MPEEGRDAGGGPPPESVERIRRISQIHIPGIGRETEKK